MARGFPADDNAILVYAAQRFTAMPFGTLAIVARRGAATGSFDRVAFLLGPEATDAWEFELSSTSADRLGTFTATGAAARNAVTATTLGNWELWVWRKATGTATPVGSIYDWPTNVMVAAENFSGTVPDTAQTGLATHQVGGFSLAGGGPAGGGSDFNGDIAAIMAINGRVISDGEVSRLPRGRWDQWDPDLLLEYPSGRDNPGGQNRDNSRSRMRQTSGGTASVRTALTDPPGFKWSRHIRRR